MLAALTDAQWGLVTTAAVAIAGIVGQVVLARHRHVHERELADVDRRQRRREDAYFALLTTMARVVSELDRDWQLDRKPRSGETIAQAIEVGTRSGLVGSDEVRGAVVAWSDAVLELIEVVTASAARESCESRDVDRYNALRAAERRKYGCAAKAMRAELA